MANYSFRCFHCGEFTLWLTAADNTTHASCPDCGIESKRVFKPPNTFRMDSSVKHRIEKGKEPRVMKKEELSGTPFKRPKPRVARPWQVGH